ncbi:MAG: serine/threonine protein kinase, partial [Methanomicrobiales archaeon]|nr:serine/threonine protein kinase [Methanomicrobiales archaeon]
FFVVLGVSGGVLYFLRCRSKKAISPGTSSDTFISHEIPAPHLQENSPAGGIRDFPMELRDRYTGIEYAGKGGIARVFKAIRRSDGRTVAVKIPVTFDEATGKSFLKEMRVWEDLRHPNIVEVSEVNILPVPYVEMEYFECSLDQVKKPLDLRDTLKIVKGLADGLAYAHRMGVIHRDLKPHNILLSEDMTPKIADWGLSRILSHETAASMTGFSLPYASPEQISPRQFGPTGPWTDLYQLGVILYELVTGTPPFTGEGIYDTGTAILYAKPAIPPSLPPEMTALVPVIMKCLEKEPAQRYQSGEEFMDDLMGHLSEHTSRGLG